MRMLIDAEGAKRMAYLCSSTFFEVVSRGERDRGAPPAWQAHVYRERHYFAARDCLAIVVVRVQHRSIIGNNALSVLKGKVVDAEVGWDHGEAGFVFKPNIGKRHSKATLYKIWGGAEYDMTLSGFLDGAPRGERR
jgi:hypothetical protein